MPSACYVRGDLYTGTKSFVTNMEWIEQPIVPSTVLPDPHRFETSRNTKTSTTTVVYETLDVSTFLTMTVSPEKMGELRSQIASHGPG